MIPLVQRIEKIISLAKENKPDELNNAKLDYVAIFCQSADEYDSYNEEAHSLGQILSEKETGITYKLSKPLQTEEGDLSLLKIRKPDSKRKELGAPVYIVDNYNDVKTSMIESGLGKITSSADGFELIEINVNDEVLIYVPKIALSNSIKNSNVIEGKNSSNSSQEGISDLLKREKEKRLQLMADFENYKKRLENERATFGAIANMGLIQELLEINDDIQLALDDDELDLERAKLSLQTAQDKLKGAAKNAGVEAVEVKPGDDFDKEKMEAIQAVPNAEMKNKVIAVISSAYKYIDKEGIIKPAKVIVGK